MKIAMSILSEVQEKYSEIGSLIPASNPLEVPVMARHRKGAKANHWDCTMSRAVKELMGADAVYTSLSALVVIKDGKATIYSHGSGSREIVTINDTRGEVVDQAVWLNSPNQKQQILAKLIASKDGIPKRVLEAMYSQTSTRIHELREQGHVIKSVPGCDGRVTYKYVSAPERTTPGKRYSPRTERKYRRMEKADPMRDRA
jgi:hypothetical protein